MAPLQIVVGGGSLIRDWWETRNGITYEFIDYDGGTWYAKEIPSTNNGFGDVPGGRVFPFAAPPGLMWLIQPGNSVYEQPDSLYLIRAPSCGCSAA